MPEFRYSDYDENRFWIQVMGENAEILYNRLIPERTEAPRAKEFIRIFENLYNRIDKNMPAENLAQINRDAYAATRELRDLITGVLRSQVLNGIFINLKPMYINNLISLADQYLYLLESLLNNRIPVYNPIEMDIFWLPIFYTETRLLTDALGDYPVELRERSQNLTYRINLFFQTAISLWTMYTRLGRSDFPIALEYRDGIRQLLLLFAELVVDVIGEERQKRLPGTLTLVDLDCMYRKVCYYTRQISGVDNKPMPACDPGSPRLSLV